LTAACGFCRAFGSAPCGSRFVRQPGFGFGIHGIDADAFLRRAAGQPIKLNIVGLENQFDV
jgi:hypothetical protein